jgi:putative PEP-CTERM system TPR-repeat lipoprotein
MKSNGLKTLLALLLGLVLGACADESPEKRIASAKAYLQKNDTKAAVIEIKNALQKNPDLGEARYLLGSTMLKEGNAIAAEVELRKALAAKYPEEVVLPDLARSMLLLGQAKKVVDEFGNTRMGKPNADASLQVSVATAYAALGKPEQAQSALTTALEADSQYAPALLLRARQKAVDGDFDGALGVTDDVIGREPGNVEAWKLKGDLLLHTKKKPDEALVAYRQALQADPRFVLGHMAILTLLLQQGNLDEAAEQLEKLKKFAARNLQTIYFEAQLAYQKKDLKLAKELSQQLLQQSPNNPRVLQLAGAVELQLGSVAQAEIYLSKAAQLAPELALTRRLLVVTYLRSGQSAKALTALNAAGKGSVDPALYSLAGEVHLQNGDAKKAEEYFAKALKLDPENAAKRTALAITQLESGQTSIAFGELANIAASDAGATADFALISAHLRRREFDKALVAIARLEAKQPDKATAANLRGRVQLAQEDKAGARKSFEQALSIDPNFFAAAASLATLDLADQKPDEARQRFESLLARNPRNGQALLALAQVAAANGAGKEELAGLLTRAVEANPSDPAPRLLLIDLLLRSKDTKQALVAAQSGVAALPNSPELLGALGQVQKVSGELNQAIATYGRLVAMQPLAPLSHIRLAEAKAANKDILGAEQSLRKALEIKPDQLDAQRGLIALSVEANKYQDAISIARTMQTQRPKEAVGYVLEGDIHSAQQGWVAAAAAYRAGLQQIQSPELATKLHAVTVRSGKGDEADRFATAWLKAHPKDVIFLSYLGDTAVARKDYAAAEGRYLAVLQIRNDSAATLNNLAWVTHQLRKEGALAYAERANKLVPNQPAFMDTLAMLLSAKGEHSKAVELQRKALELQPSNASLRLNLAKVYLAADDKVRAKTELDVLAKLGEKYPSQPEVAALLKTL